MLALGLALVAPWARAAMPAGVSCGVALGWTNTFTLRDDHGKTAAVIVPGIGGRVVQYSRSGWAS